MSVSAADAEPAAHRRSILKWISRRFPSPTAGLRKNQDTRELCVPPEFCGRNPMMEPVSSTNSEPSSGNISTISIQPENAPDCPFGGSRRISIAGPISDMRMAHVDHYNNALALYIEAFDNPSASNEFN